jgi:hypothetical protein
MPTDMLLVCVCVCVCALPFCCQAHAAPVVVGRAAFSPHLAVAPDGNSAELAAGPHRYVLASCCRCVSLAANQLVAERLMGFEQLFLARCCRGGM